MKIKSFPALLTVAAMAVALTGCSTDAEQDSATKNPSATVAEKESDVTLENEAVVFSPVDCGIQAQDVYEYPFLGLTAKLSQNMLDYMNSRDVFVSVKDDYTDSMTVKTAMMCFFAPTQEQKAVSGISVDYMSWEESLEKVGVLGVYQKEQSAQLDTLTGCDSHKKLGESEDGAYEYYLSTNSQGSQEFIKELEETKVMISTMRSFDADCAYTAFSTGKEDNVATVGEFKTEDIFGKAYTEDMFGDYDLTLVNAFTTWCSPCVEEMPELEKLRKAFEKKGISFNVVAVVIDAKTKSGLDEAAIERAKILHERSGAEFPFLIADDGNMNDRLKGLESFPESFFVDKNGNIVSEAYLGARSLEAWTKIVQQELDKLEGAE